MLLEMGIENFILIKKLNISFTNGLNVFTGETGAGKSMIIGGINIGLGEKISDDVVGIFGDKAVIQLVFSVENPEVSEILVSNGIDLEDQMLIITREIFPSHRSVVRMNGRVVTLSVLKEVSSHLIDIHGQHAHQALLYPKNHLHYLDLMGDNTHDRLIKSVEKSYKRIKDLESQIKDIEEDQSPVDEDYLSFQIQEIDALNLKEDEDEALSQKYGYYKNIEMIFKNMQQIYDAFSGDDNPYSIKDTSTKCSQLMQPVAAFDPVLTDLSDNLQSLVYQIDDIGLEIRRYIEGLEVDEAEMHEVESRMNAVNDLKLKHGKTITDILNKRDKLQKQLSDKLGKQDQLNHFRKLLMDEKKIYLDQAQKLHESRHQLVADFENHVMDEMSLLNMIDGQFKVDFQDNNLEAGAYRLSKNGFDQVSFLISTNPGMALSPLSKVASGGEISRMMLAIKMALAHHDEVRTLVFDEVDTGISGATALVVGEKMHQLTINYQVLLITHLAQIAIMADQHFMIDKVIEGQRTETKVRTLNSSERQKEIARMLSGDETSKISIENAQEMMENAQKFKALS